MLRPMKPESSGLPEPQENVDFRPQLWVPQQGPQTDAITNSGAMPGKDANTARRGYLLQHLDQYGPAEMAFCQPAIRRGNARRAPRRRDGRPSRIPSRASAPASASCGWHDFLGDLEGVVDFDAKITHRAFEHRAFDLGMAERLGFIPRVSYLIENQRSAARRSVLAAARRSSSRRKTPDQPP